MSAKERLLSRVGSLIEKTAAAVLWKYVDPDGDTFYMEERRLSTTRSPFSGKSFTAKPVRQSLTDVAKELRSGDAKVKGALWKYVDPEGSAFYCDQRLVGSIKSPVTGKTFPAKPEKFTLSEVGKSLKLDKSTPGEDAESGVDAKFLQEMKDMLSAKGYDPEFATKLQGEGMGPTELEERLKDPQQFDFNYAAPKMKLAETKVDPTVAAETKVAALTSAEKKVVDAFYERKPAEGGMLTTDGKKLEKKGLGGSDFAEWKGDKIVIHPDRPMVKNDEEILRYMKKSIPANSLADHAFFRKSAGSQEQWDLAAAIIKDREKHPAIKVIKDQYNKILEALEECDKHSKGLQRVGAGHTEDHTFVMTYVEPEIRELAETCQVVAKQLEQRLGRAK